MSLFEDIEKARKLILEAKPVNSPNYVIVSKEKLQKLGMDTTGIPDGSLCELDLKSKTLRILK